MSEIRAMQGAIAETAEMQKECRPLLRIPAPAALVHLTSRDGGNAEGL
jgi:hypothetical protein